MSSLRDHLIVCWTMKMGNYWAPKRKRSLHSHTFRVDMAGPCPTSLINMFRSIFCGWRFTGKTYRLVQSIQYIASDSYRLTIERVLLANGFVNVLYQLVELEIFHVFLSHSFYPIWSLKGTWCVCVGKNNLKLGWGRQKWSILYFWRASNAISIDF